MADPKGPTGPTAIDDLKSLLFIMAILWLLWYMSGGADKMKQSGGALPIIGDGGSSIKQDGSSDLGEIPSAEVDLLRATSGENYLQVIVSGRNKSNLDITNWQVGTASGSYYRIGKTAGLPIQGDVNPGSNTIVSSGSTLIISEQASPTGYSFRVNKCAGYLSQFQNFEPALNNDCGAPIGETDLPVECIAYASNLTQCRAPILEAGDNIPPVCRTYFDSRFNYNGCVSAHKSDPDFFKNEWRIYLNSGEKIWGNGSGTLRLLDDKGAHLDSLSF